MASSILNVGISGLNAAQVGLTVTGNNIANVNTPGYNRQQAIQSPSKEQDTGFGFVGQGASVVEVRRFYDELLTNQVNSAQSSNAEVTVYKSQMDSINNLLSGEASGLSPALSDFFNSISGVASNPGDAAARQAFVSSASSLQSRFNDLASNLEQAQLSVNEQIKGSVDVINGYAKQLAALNEKIEKSTNATGQAPNTLLDQRDNLVTELSKQINTTVVKQVSANNNLTSSYNIFIGNGQPLVIGTTANSLVAMQSPADPSRIEVAFKGVNSNVLLGETSIKGGVLGGLVEFRSKSLDKIQNQLGQIGIAVAATYNEQNALGTDQFGNAGQALFATPQPEVIKNANNSGTLEISATIVDSSQLPDSNYELSYDGVNYVIRRLSDGFQQTFATLPLSLNGIDFANVSGAPATGDRILIKPTINGALNFKSVIDSGADLAAGGTPFAGPGDNRNALTLAKLNTNLTINNGTESFGSSYNKLVSSVGVKSSELNLSAQAEQGFLSQAVEAQQSVSGVNLDEEAANLLKYQQAYQASGKLLKVVSELFDTLLALR